jgi:hypothetical protein
MFAEPAKGALFTFVFKFAAKFPAAGISVSSG